MGTSNPRFYGDMNVYAKLNKLILKLSGQTNQGIFSLPYQSHIEVTMSTTQSLANAVWTKIAFNTVGIDNQSEYNNTTYRFTAKESGTYLVSSNIVFAQNNNRTRGIWIYKNGVSTNYRIMQDTEDKDGTASLTYVAISVPIYLLANDFIEIYGYQNRGGTLNVNNTNSWFNTLKIT